MRSHAQCLAPSRACRARACVCGSYSVYHHNKETEIVRVCVSRAREECACREREIDRSAPLWWWQPPLFGEEACGVGSLLSTHIYIYTHTHKHLYYITITRPQVERQYPPNLSILISGGKETNRDSLSSGERSGRSPSSESGRAPSPCPELWSHGKASLSAVAGRAKVPWKRAPGRVTAPSIGPASRPSRLRCCTCPRVGLFGNAALSGW